MNDSEVELAGWGRCPVQRGHEYWLDSGDPTPSEVTLWRGLGRSYGDASLPAGAGGSVANGRRADRILDFDPECGRVRIEAGCSLRRLLAVFGPAGWWSPVCPGTQDVTIGGMVAADVHGKNHHRDGSFGRWVDSVRIELADGSWEDVSRTREPELFRATIGGMGLTGFIREVSFRLISIPSRSVIQETRRTRGIDATCETLRAAGEEAPYTVSWVDLMGRDLDRLRGVTFAGRWATRAEAVREPQSPGAPKSWPLPRVRASWIRWANRAYAWRHRSGTRRVAAEPFFFPLDGVREWNRTYGDAGFIQYQAVVPWGADHGGARRLIERFRKLDGVSYLTVIKDCGEAGDGQLSFPMRGVTVTFDVPMSGDPTRELVRGLNAHVIEAGGRVYLAKDALTTAAEYRRMDGRWRDFEGVRRRWDPNRRLRSALSARLFDEGNA
ncbi:MAG: FAD-binding oxidoreductase [Planctomycetota bacterium]